jgi:hypothetical protein
LWMFRRRLRGSHRQRCRGKERDGQRGAGEPSNSVH